MTIIFKNILEGDVFSQKQFLEYLKAYPLNSWLIRESRIKGMLTIEKRTGDNSLTSYRFAYMNGRWSVLLGNHIADSIVKKIKYEYITAESSGYARQQELLKSLLSLLSNLSEFSNQQMVIPENRYVSQDYIFSEERSLSQEHNSIVLPQFLFHDDEQQSLVADWSGMQKNYVNEIIARLRPHLSDSERHELLTNNPIIEQLANYIFNEEFKKEDLQFIESKRSSSPSSSSSSSFFSRGYQISYIQSVANSLLEHSILGQNIPRLYEDYLENNHCLEISKIWNSKQNLDHQDNHRVYVTLD